MAKFNILDRNQSIHHHGMLEASAGTGKTFAIENLVVRFLIENRCDSEPLLLEEILIVTFTRAATSDLKDRIQRNLLKSIATVKAYLSSGVIGDWCPDYLRAQLDPGQLSAKKVLRRLEQALFSYDQAQIFTIHGFCSRMLRQYSLEGDVSIIPTQNNDAILEKSILTRVVRDFLRTELDSESYSPAQLSSLLKESKRDLDKLQRQLLSDVSRGLSVRGPPSFKTLFLEFQSVMRNLKKEYVFEGEKVISDFYAQAPQYNKLADKKGHIHHEYIEIVHRFADLFDREWCSEKDFDGLIRDGLFLCEAFDPSRLKKRKKSDDPIPPLHYPKLLEILQGTLSSIVLQARHPGQLYARLVSDCQKFVRRFRNKEEMVGHNDLLTGMHRAISNPLFANKVRGLYSAAIVDEFQDTDPLQWEIFASLFMSLNWKGYLYLVGDPKQSIYAFRQADIYTYLKAANHLGSDAFATLDTNFRSQPSLISALNSLFSAAQNLFPLPKQNGSLAYRDVSAGISTDKVFTDKASPIQFWIAKIEKSKKGVTHDVYQDDFFPAIADALIKLRDNDGILFRQNAILVSDKYQAAELAPYLKKLGIPVKNQRAVDLGSSPSFAAMRELLDGVLNYRNVSVFKLALAGRVINMTHQEILDLYTLPQEPLLLSLYRAFDLLRDILMNKGFGVFYGQLMQTTFFSDGLTLMQRMLRMNEGLIFYCAWQDVADLLVEMEQKEALTPDGLLSFLEKFDPTSNDEEDKKMKAYFDAGEDGVSILTTHASKGLEFDVVFCLGLASQTKSKSERLIVMQDGVSQYLGAPDGDDDPRYRLFHKENDAEKMRQLYVAFTRAKYRLYIPVIVSQEPTSIEEGKASPIELFLARLGQPPADYHEWYERLNRQDYTALERFIEEQGSGDISLRILQEENLTDMRAKLESSPVLLPPNQVVIYKPNLVIQSFSSLQSPKDITKEHLDEAVPVPHLFSAEFKTPHTLPAGNETGVLLHKIFELIPFNSMKDVNDSDRLLPWIQPLIENTSFQSWESIICQMVLDTIKSNLPGTEFCFADLNPKKIYRETEFLYGCQREDPSIIDLYDRGLRQGYLNGVIDLMFEYEGKYYLVDWKSNWIGPTAAHYHLESLHHVMILNQYDLQAKIYVEALRRYLRLFSDAPFEDLFGGIYYVFIRGNSAYRWIM